MKEIIGLIRQYGDACWNSAVECGKTGVLDGPKSKQSADLESSLIQAIRDKIEGGETKP